MLAGDSHRKGKEVVTMAGIGYFGTGFSLVLVMLVTTILFVYIWLRSHGVMHRLSHANVDSMAGDEGED